MHGIVLYCGGGGDVGGGSRPSNEASNYITKPWFIHNCQVVFFSYLCMWMNFSFIIIEQWINQSINRKKMTATNELFENLQLKFNN